MPEELHPEDSSIGVMRAAAKLIRELEKPSRTRPSLRDLRGISVWALPILRAAAARHADRVRAGVR